MGNGYLFVYATINEGDVCLVCRNISKAAELIKYSIACCGTGCYGRKILFVDK